MTHYLVYPKVIWCERGDLNPHGLRHTPLKRACLPVPALSRYSR